MSTVRYPGSLTPEQIEEFGREMDAIRDEVMDSRGERDRRYITRLIRVQRSMALGGRVLIYAGLFCLPAWGHVLAGWITVAALIGLGTLTLGLSKILENMEIAHNVLHAQWDWMKDPEIQSNTWEWDNMSPSDRWMHSHNVVHHTWTNVLEKDLDVGYGILRVTPLQEWKPKYLPQPIYAFLLMMFFEEGVALHEQCIIDWVEKRKTWAEIRPMMQHIWRKMRREILKDYIMWPGAAALVAWPISLWVPESPWTVFALVAGANFIANIIRNVWAFIIIFCGHFPAGVHMFTPAQVEGETRAHWYMRQLLGSANIGGGKLFHILSGNLSHQIEHHLFPDMCSNRYPEVSPRVRALATRYGLPYNTGSLTRQFGTTVWKILRFSLPGGGTGTGEVHKPATAS
ncbi:MAG: fatty acid desaturase protein [Moraxellaceae bacterium]|jgi:linoleoyl-CoA desaturase|nr:fatty acid desaturase protein [Moraxellaceae bacterium]